MCHRVLFAKSQLFADYSAYVTRPRPANIRLFQMMHTGMIWSGLSKRKSLVDACCAAAGYLGRQSSPTIGHRHIRQQNDERVERSMCPSGSARGSPVRSILASCHCTREASAIACTLTSSGLSRYLIAARVCEAPLLSSAPGQCRVIAVRGTQSL